MVRRQALGEGLGGVVLSLHQRLPGHVVLHGIRNGFAVGSLLHRFGGRVFDVVGASGLFVDPSPGDAFLEDRIGDLQLHDLRDAGALLGQHLVEGLGLRQRSGESVQDEAVFAVVFLDAIADDPHHDVVADEPSGVHDGLGLLADLGSGGNGSAEHVTGRQGGDPEELLDLGSVGSLSGSRWSEQDHDVTGPVAGEFYFGFLDGRFGGFPEVLGLVGFLLLQSDDGGNQTGGGGRQSLGSVVAGSLLLLEARGEADGRRGSAGSGPAGCNSEGGRGDHPD
mmetsp:Transcript_3908/g.10225  ORF Transcript_3908/g.10225 Transcript_3908/m.10225 type:complete len:280 (-) Transcript_3908:143-982(-)